MRTPRAVSTRPLATWFLALAVVAAAALTLLPATPASAAARRSASTTTHRTTHQWEKAVARHVLQLLNRERRAHGRANLRGNAKLIRSAHGHNLAMAAANEMSHQLPGEAYFATRISRARYRWTYAGENVGWNSVRTLTGVLDLETIMYNERPPGEVGHRQNILSRHYRDVGIDVYVDARNQKVWLTEDFGHH